MPLAMLEREPITALEHERSALTEAGQLLDHLTTNSQQERRARLVGSNGEEVDLPEALFEVLRQAIQHLLQGHSVAIAPLHKEMTTQQAAELLNVSRPYLIQLLEEGQIPFTKTGTHRRVRLGDVLTYRKQRDADREVGMRRLAALSQELGLYDV